MPIQVSCACGAGLRVPDTLAGRKARCPKCKSVLDVPAAAPAPEVKVELAPVPLPPERPKGPRRPSLASRRPLAQRPRHTPARTTDIDDYGKGPMRALGIVLLVSFLLPIESGMGMMWPWDIVSQGVQQGEILGVLMWCFPLVGGLLSILMPLFMPRNGYCGFALAIATLPFVLVLGYNEGAQFYGQMGGWRIPVVYAGLSLIAGGVNSIRNFGSSDPARWMAGAGAGLVLIPFIVPISAGYGQTFFPIIEWVKAWQGWVTMLPLLTMTGFAAATMLKRDRSEDYAGYAFLAFYLTLAVGVLIVVIELSRAGAMQGGFLIALLKVYTYAYGMVLLAMFGLTGLTAWEEPPVPAHARSPA